MAINLNELARSVTLGEGKKKSISIAQVKEVMKILLMKLAECSEADAIRVIRKYRRKGMVQEMSCKR